MIDLIAFDADDTLWHNENLYARGMERFNRLLAKYPVKAGHESRQQEIEVHNLQYYGYGVAGFVLSLIEAAIELTEGQILGRDLQDLLDLSKEMLSAEVELFEQAEETVVTLARAYPLMLITKGDLRHQQSKIARSGLRDYFRSIEIVSDKTREIYADILSRHQLQPSRFLMVGDSLRSDILPILELGGWAVHVPSQIGWAHEQVDFLASKYDRFFEVQDLGRLPGLIERLDSNMPRLVEG